MTLDEKLIKIREETPYLKKEAKSFKYQYVSGSQVLGQIRQKMDELGVLLFPNITFTECDGIPQHITPDGTMQIESTDEHGNVSKKRHVALYRFEAPGLMTWKDAASGEKLEIPWYFVGKQDDPSKAFGSALTYSERYFLLKFFNIPTDDEDPDAFKEKHYKPEPAKPEKQEEQKPEPLEEEKPKKKKTRKKAEAATEKPEPKAEEPEKKAEEKPAEKAEPAGNEELVAKIAKAFDQFDVKVEALESYMDVDSSEWGEAEKEELLALYHKVRAGDPDAIASLKD